MRNAWYRLLRGELVDCVLRTLGGGKAENLAQSSRRDWTFHTNKTLA